MPNLHESLGRMTSDRDDIADRYAQALEVLDGLKKGRISLENIQLTPQGWKVVVPEKPAYSTGDPSLPPAKFIGPEPEQPPFETPVDLAPPQTGPRPAPGTEAMGIKPGDRAHMVSPVRGAGEPLFHED